MMTAREIKEELSKKNIRLVEIANKFRTTPSNVGQLFDHKPTKNGLPSLIRQHIADAIGKTYKEVWE